MSQDDRRRVRAAVLGSPVGHSLSPALHRAAYAALGLTWWRYEAIECDEADLSALLDSCGPDWAGLSLTMPLKRTVLPLLDRSEPLVTAVGAANTVVFAAAQRLGYNTDVLGIVRALAEHGVLAGEKAAGSAATDPAGSPQPSGAQRSGARPSEPPPRRSTVTGPALILGAGATACAALAALGDLGERSATVIVRDPGRAGEISSVAARLGMAITLRPFARASFTGARLIISTVPAGAADFVAQIFPQLVPAPDAVFDVVYHPWPTALAAAAAKAGAIVVSGFDLLLHQAARQVELMTDRAAPVEAMRKAGLAELARRADPPG